MAETEIDSSPIDTGNSDGGKLLEGMVPKTASKRGRPPGSKNKGTPLDTGFTEEKRPMGGANADKAESAKFIGVGFVALVELAESFIHSSCANKIEKRLPHKLIEFRQMAKDLGLQDKDKEIMQDSVEKIASKYGFLTAHGPEIVLGVMMVQYGMRQVSLMRFVENVTKQKEPEKVAPASMETGAPKV